MLHLMLSEAKHPARFLAALGLTAFNISCSE